MSIKKISLLTLTLVSFSTYAMECEQGNLEFKQLDVKQNYNKFRGQVITAQNVMKLQDSTATPKSHECIQYIKKNSDKIPKNAFSKDVRYGDFIQVRSETNSNNTDSFHEFYFFSAQTVNRLKHLNSLIFNTDPYDDPRFVRHIPYILESNEPSFQIVSCAAYSLKLLEFIEKTDAQNIKYVPVQLVQPFANKNQAACDANTLAIQEVTSPKLDLLHQSDKAQEVVRSWNEQTVRELHGAIAYTPLWQAHVTAEINPDKPQEIRFRDLQQPDNSGSFFYSEEKGKYRGYSKFVHDAWCGLGGSDWRGSGMLELLQQHGAEEQAELWKELSAEIAQELGEGP